MHQIFSAIRVFFDNFRDVGFEALGYALVFHLLKLFTRARAWRNILVAAFPSSKVKTRYVLGAYAAGVGVNAIVPARGGDAVKLVLVKHRIDDSNYPALASSLLVETIVDFVLASAFLAWAFSTGILPGLDVLPKLPSIDWWWPIHHPRVSAIVGALLVLVLIGLAFWGHRKVDSLRARFAQGMAILHDPPRYVTGVVTWQVLSWVLRLGTVYWCLVAFHVPATVTNVLTVQVVEGLSTILPFSPGGVGTKQGLLVYMLRGQAAGTTLLSLSVGMYLLITAANVVTGMIALLLMQRSLRFRHRVPAAEPGPG